MLLSNLLCFLSAVSLVLPASGISHAVPVPAGSKTFVSRVSNVTLTYMENSGICETTPGVHQVSGYVTVGRNMHMWFWFFAARNSPEKAPFTLWLNGGPGCSSMIGLFLENGPCKVNADNATTVKNPYSWNEVSNMIYIDQPIGTGFSYGRDPVTSTKAAAPYVWQAFQVLFESKLFSQYQSRQFNLATESYGGHYAPAFATYFRQQNARIARGSLHGAVKLNLNALLINNGWIDSLIQSKAYIEFVARAPGYGPLVSASDLKMMNDLYYSPKGCQVQQKACSAVADLTTSGSNKICSNASNVCSAIGGIAIGKRNPYDLRQSSAAAVSPESRYYLGYLRRQSVMSAIGAKAKYEECPDGPNEKFSLTGDASRTFLPQLAALANSGLKILIWAGDADIICNWVGNHQAVLAMQWSGKATLARTPFRNITVSGKTVAAVKNVKNFSFARVYGAGHMVPAYQPAASLAIFKQIINGEALHSV